MAKIFNDPIHGRIEIPDYCIKIIDTPEFQRLRNLKQLGLTSYVFYGATHTRFEHSIGVCYLSGEWARHLQKKHPELDITDIDIEIVMISGLVHDIGHGPFSHTFERFIKKTRPDTPYNHEDMTIKIIKQMGGCIEDHILKSVWKIIAGITMESKPFLAHIVHNTINGLDADKLDYFIRDSQCTSFAIGCDWKRIVYESRVVDNEIVFPYKMVGDIFNVYQTRFRLYKEVYFHKTVCAIEDILLDTLILADEMSVFKFNDSQNRPKSLSHSIDDISSFLFTQDDIIGQMERCGIPAITNSINKLKNRDFGSGGAATEHRYAHYGLGDKNPLKFVKFVDNNNFIRPINIQLIESMCPQIFFLNC